MNADNDPVITNHKNCGNMGLIFLYYIRSMVLNSIIYAIKKIQAKIHLF